MPINTPRLIKSEKERYNNAADYKAFGGKAELVGTKGS
jgi:hypothetical protein